MLGPLSSNSKKKMVQGCGAVSDSHISAMLTPEEVRVWPSKIPDPCPDGSALSEIRASRGAGARGSCVGERWSGNGSRERIRAT